MAQILVRNLDPDVVERLKQRAKRRRRSLQAEARTILEEAAEQPQVEREDFVRMANEFRKSLGRRFSDSAELIREDRDR